MKPLWMFVVAFLVLSCSKVSDVPELQPPSADTVVVDTPSEDQDTVDKPIDTPVVKPTDPFLGKRLRYLALGDSYTIGEGVALSQNFPNQFVGFMAEAGWIVHPPKIIARTGWTTGDLLLATGEQPADLTFDLVTLLIGVNNQYIAGTTEVYRREFKTLLDQAIDFADGDKTRVVVISIPDWGVTPFARRTGRDLEQVSAEIDAFNAAAAAECAGLGITFMNITPASREAARDLSLLAADGLHPSGKMYASWATQLREVMLAKLK